ncbi:CLUMA_CG000474, isoform A [Clunio marinus]|uniref:CLUMA_CG000474, isoform A n=1 Tax=Clunio marinus TaxID=568069 RepID=A0A1J1HJJ1_9DIPT|nr:CLUMA_CG000474, isoform A [Clunio marinus]
MCLMLEEHCAMWKGSMKEFHKMINICRLDHLERNVLGKENEGIRKECLKRCRGNVRYNAMCGRLMPLSRRMMTKSIRMKVLFQIVGKKNMILRPSMTDSERF